jgi:short-subunit dehydrogenase
MSRLNHQSLDGVILNAGILHFNGLHDLDVEAIRQQFEVNALAPLRLASVLTSNLSSGGLGLH